MKRTFALLVTIIITFPLTFTHADTITSTNIKILPLVAPEKTETVPAAADKSEVLHAQLRTRPGIKLASEITGRIKHLALQDGQHFKTGQVLAKFSCPKEETQVAQLRTLFKQQTQVSKQLEETHSINTLEIDLANIEQTEAAAKLQVAEALLDRCVIHAPFAGKVIKRLAKDAQSVRVGDPLLEIANEDNQEVELLVSAMELQHIKLGKHYQVNLDNMNKSYKIELTGVGGHIDPENQTVKIYGYIDNTKSATLPNSESFLALMSPIH